MLSVSLINIHTVIVLHKLIWYYWGYKCMSISTNLLCPCQINKLLISDTGIVLWIPGSWWRSTTRDWGWTWTCREQSSSSGYLRWVSAATKRRKHVSATSDWLPVLPLLFSKVTKTKGLRPMTLTDVAGTHSLLQTNSSRFQLSSILSLQEVEHWLLPRENVIDTYVVEVWRLQHLPSKCLCLRGKALNSILLLTLRLMMVPSRMWWVSTAAPSGCWTTRCTLTWEQLTSCTWPPPPQTWPTSWRTHWSSLNPWVRLNTTSIWGLMQPTRVRTLKGS